jgi:hypothetical protein
MENKLEKMLSLSRKSEVYLTEMAGRNGQQSGGVMVHRPPFGEFGNDVDY